MPTGNHVTRWLRRNDPSSFVCFVIFVVPSLCHAPLLSLEISRVVFHFFRGSLRCFFGTRSVTMIGYNPLVFSRSPSSSDTIRDSALLSPIWDKANRVTRACHLERIVPKHERLNWSYKRFYRSPLSLPLDTSLGAPGRTQGKREKGGRTDRWPQRIALPSGRIPPGVEESDLFSPARCCCRTCLARLLGRCGDRRPSPQSGTERG